MKVVFRTEVAREFIILIPPTPSPTPAVTPA
jgi:hypothetical protein